MNTTTIPMKLWPSIIRSILRNDIRDLHALVINKQIWTIVCAVLSEAMQSRLIYRNENEGYNETMTLQDVRRFILAPSPKRKSMRLAIGDTWWYAQTVLYIDRGTTWVELSTRNYLIYFIDNVGIFTADDYYHKHMYYSSYTHKTYTNINYDLYWDISRDSAVKRDTIKWLLETLLPDIAPKFRFIRQA